MHVEPSTSLTWAYQLHYYLCFRTRWRRARFENPGEAESLSRTLAEVCLRHQYHLLQHKVFADHLRCLLSLRPDHSISHTVNTLKSNLSREICTEFRITAPLWATGYLARSIGKVRIQAVKQYLDQQSEHHGYASRLRSPVFRFRETEPVTLSSSHCAFDLAHHLVFATQCRRGIFDSALGRELVEYWLRVAQKHRFAIDQATVLPDHVHLLVRLIPKRSIEECALSLMNNAQHWMAKHHPVVMVAAGVDRLWQQSAFAGTCGQMTTALLKRFLASNA